MTLQGLEYLSYPIDGASFCDAAKGARIADLEHWCGREGLGEFIQAFKFDEWEYRFQRATWETPDGKHNLYTPGLDLIRAIKLKYSGGVIP